MPHRKSKPKFRFWLGGPTAYPWREYWVGKKKSMDGGYCYVSGCFIVRDSGFEIPEDTYYHADARVSQDLIVPLFDDRPTVGRNFTALLPLEVDE